MCCDVHYNDNPAENIFKVWLRPSFTNMKKSLYEYCIENLRPDLLEQWDAEKNAPLTPHDVSYGSKKKVWWHCEKGHSWDTVVYSRTSRGCGCPICSGQRLNPELRSLAVECPELLKEWHPDKNADISPYQVLPGSHRRVWWQCEKGHEWQAIIKSRALSGCSCPICTNRKVQTGENDLATTHPDIASQWHPTKNGDFTPQQFVAGKKRKVWWMCEKGHEWQASIDSRTAQNVDCPICAGKVVIPGENDLASAFPDIAAQWHPEKNGTLMPDSVTPYSNKNTWWKCELGHEYKTTIAARTHRKSGCPYCIGRKVLPGFNDLATKDPKLAKQWHPELNGALTPEMVTVGSRKHVWWQCPSGHVWKAKISSRATGRKCGCPVCAGKVKESKNIGKTPLFK